MSLLPRRGCPAASLALLVLVLALAGCGGAPEGPVLADEAPGAVVPESARARSESLTRLGQTALQSGEIEQAASLFEQATLTDGRNVRAALGLGDTLLAAGRDLDASQAFERALKVQPDLPEAHYGYARAMIGIRRPEVAVDHLRRLTESRPSDTAALNALGVAHDLLGEHQLATQTYRKGLAMVPASVPLRNNLALSLALQEQFPEALEELRPIAEGPGSTRRTRQNLALVYGLQGDFAGAERLSRVDLAGADLQGNLSYFATVRGLENPVLQAAALAPSGELAWDELRPARQPKASARRARGADMVPPAPAAPVVVAPPAAQTEPAAARAETVDARARGSGRERDARWRLVRRCRQVSGRDRGGQPLAGAAREACRRPGRARQARRCRRRPRAAARWPAHGRAGRPQGLWGARGGRGELSAGPAIAHERAPALATSADRAVTVLVQRSGPWSRCVSISHQYSDVEAA